MKTSLVVPAYNEEKGLPQVVWGYLDIVDEIILIDGGSGDRTIELGVGGALC
jgi:glycosyltransferase involved in cell wall biosynthesis